MFNGVMHGEQLAVRRDPSTYAQYAIWLAREGSLPIPARPEAFGGADPSLIFESVGFYAVGDSVVPQFMPGAPMLFALGEWLGGLFLAPVVLGGRWRCSPWPGWRPGWSSGRWAPVAALAFACCMPIIYTSRATFSEIPSMLLLLGGLALVHDALYGHGRRIGAALGGLTLGLAVLVRVDGLRDVLPVLAFAGLLVAMGRRSPGRHGGLGPPLLAGLAAGAGLGLAAGYGLSRPYLTYLSSSMRPLLLICAAVLVLTLAGTVAAPLLARLRPPGWLPAAGGDAGGADHGRAGGAALAGDRAPGPRQRRRPAHRHLHRADPEGQRPADRRHPPVLRAHPALGGVVRGRPGARARHAGRGRADAPAAARPRPAMAAAAGGHRLGHAHHAAPPGDHPPTTRGPRAAWCRW
ncbi:hypothetical protein ACFSTC_49375 [Nonomuraea ferruginea]